MSTIGVTFFVELVGVLTLDLGECEHEGGIFVEQFADLIAQLVEHVLEDVLLHPGATLVASRRVVD